MHFKTKALILKNRSVEGKNTYITAYTLNFGKVVYLAKGLNRNEARLKSALTPFSYSQIIAVPSSGEPVITGAELLNDFYPRKSSLPQFVAFYLVDLIDNLIEERISDRRILLLLVSALSLIKKNPDNRTYLLILTYFPLKLVFYLGYFPNLSVSGKKTTKNFSFNFKTGLSQSLVNVNSKNKKSVVIDQKELNFLRLIQKKSFSYLKKTTIKEDGLKKIFEFSNNYLEYSSGVSLPNSYLPVKSLLLKNN
jgi:DNA repair protein RecO